MTSKLLSVYQASQYGPVREAGISYEQLRNLVKQQKIRTVTLLKLPRIPQAALDNFVEDLSRPTAA